MTKKSLLAEKELLKNKCKDYEFINEIIKDNKKLSLKYNPEKQIKNLSEKISRLT